MFLGSQADITHLGFVGGRCPRCGHSGMLGVYESKRRMTVSVLLSVPVGQQMVVQCDRCESRMAVPEAEIPELRRRLVSANQLAELAAQAHGTVPPGFVPPNTERTLYRILQVDQDADPEVIEAAYKRLALKYHPDTSTDPAAGERMQELNQARAILGDPVRRRAYDVSIGIVRAAPRPAAMDPDDV